MKLDLEISKSSKSEPDKFFIETKLAIPQSLKDYRHINLLKTFQSRSYTQVEIEENMPKLIEECIKELRAFKHDKEFDIAIEWILPDNLFSLDVDCWQYKEDEEEEPTRIGCASLASVHIRSSRRLKTLKREHRCKKWKNKWDFMINNFQNIHQSHYIFAEIANNHKCNNELKIIDNENNIIGINFPAALQELENINYDFIIYTGIPLALWSRCKQLNVNHIKDLDKLIKKSQNVNVLNLQNLPKSVENMRLAASSNNPDHLGHHLCFLCENPYNYPPEPSY